MCGDFQVISEDLNTITGCGMTGYTRYEQDVTIVCDCGWRRTVDAGEDSAKAMDELNDLALRHVIGIRFHQDLKGRDLRQPTLRLVRDV